MAVLAIGAIWWGSTHYKVVKVDTPLTPLATATPLPVIKPTGVWRVAETLDDTVWSLDADNTRGPRRERLAWIIEDYSKTKSVPQRTGKTLYRIDCEIGHYTTLSTVFYSAKGEVQRSWREKELQSEGYAVPGSLMAAVIQNACDARFDPTPLAK